MDRVGDLYRDLEVDRVVCSSIARRAYRTTRGAALREGIHEIGPVALASVKGRRDVEKARFWTLDESLKDANPNALRHLAGATSLRLKLGVPVARWMNRADKAGALLEPDAVWLQADLRTGEEHEWAVEVDTGSYTGKQIHEKGKAFDAEFDGRQVWGVQDDDRRTFVLKNLVEAGVQYSRILVASWR